MSEPFDVEKYLKSMRDSADCMKDIRDTLKRIAQKGEERRKHIQYILMLKARKAL